MEDWSNVLAWAKLHIGVYNTKTRNRSASKKPHLNHMVPEWIWNGRVSSNTHDKGDQRDFEEILFIVTQHKFYWQLSLI